ncbi:MAG: hypothetical protein ABIO70_24325 [Pseudomonadota bacterium]
MPPDTTALTRHQPPQAIAPRGPALPVQRATVGMLEAAVSSFGDVVSAMLTDQEQVESSIEHLGWLAPTMDLLANEEAFRNAQAQLAWWDTFLAALPCPALISDHARRDWERARAERTRVRILARQEALREHQRLVAEELRQPHLQPAERARLRQVRDDPEHTSWRVDPAEYEARHLADLPPLAPLTPIVAADLDAATSFAGFNAVRAMREHPELGPRAVALDAGLAQALHGELGLSAKQAREYAPALTNIFWLALRRALERGGHSLAASVHLFLPSRDSDLQLQFSRELLESWLTYLQHLPEPEARPLLGMFGRKAIAQPERPLLEDKGQSLWQRIKGKLGGG